MQIVIPMSGFGERFRRAGYRVPKPLIPVEGKPIVAHVVDLFPGETDFLFICNEDHLRNPEYQMEPLLKRYCPTGRILAIPAHKLGPVGAVLQAAHLIDKDRPVFVNYCDFTCFWDWADFKAFAAETECAGAVPAYRGFHPHSLGSTYYAYIRDEGLWLRDIREKSPFTDRPMEEFASSGGYYFRSGELCLSAFRELVDRDISVNGEYYVSMAYRVLAERNLPVAVYELQHFMQWGTPADLSEYVNWSNIFKRLVAGDRRRPAQAGSVLMPMAGLGKRFSDAGYALPKPLIPASGKPMFVQATEALPTAPELRFVLRRDTPHLHDIEQAREEAFPESSSTVLEQPTEGQAISCLAGLTGLNLDEPVTIGTCDAAVLYDAGVLQALLSDDGPDVLVWIVRGHPDGQLRPNMFGWVEADEAGAISAVRVKQAPPDPKSDPMIVGIFTFRRASDFVLACERLVERNARINGEFYVDSLIEDAVALGLDCRIFAIDHYIGWGTPNDFRTFEYWQSCFHKWEGHPYRLERDPMVPPDAVSGLAERYSATQPARPKRLATSSPIGR